MLPSNPICPVCNYATSAIYCDLPTPEQLANGVKPLDSLPAAWWNNMWSMVNCSVNQARGAVGSFITEINNVLAGAGICPNCVCTDQLYQAIEKIRQTIGSATVAGAVKSSSTPGMVSIDENGFMIANCVGNATQLATTAHTLVGAVNELKATYDACTSGLTTAVNSKAPTYHATAEATYGVGTATAYGHLRISNTYTSDLGDTGMAASQSALYSVYNYATQISAAAIGLGNTAGCALGTASAGSATTAARSDHVHPMPTCVACADTASYLIAPSATGVCTDINGNFIHKDNTSTANWHVDSYGGNAVFAVYFEQNYVCAATFCGNLSGTATNASFINTTQAVGIKSDCYGNFHQKQCLANSWWGIFNSSCDTVFKAYFDENYVCAATFCGCLSGNAATATTSSYFCAPSATGVCTDIDGNFIHKDNTSTANWHVDSYGGNAVFAVYFEQNYVCAATFCGNLSGTATNASFINTTQAVGIKSDCYGNFHQKQCLANSWWGIFNSSCDTVFKAYFDENYVCAATFCGNLSGHADTATCVTWHCLNTDTTKPVYLFENNSCVCIKSDGVLFLGSVTLNDWNIIWRFGKRSLKIDSLGFGEPWIYYIPLDGNVINN